MALPTTQYGGQLPVESWPKADQLVAAAWGVYADLAKRVGNNDVYGALPAFKREVEKFAAQTERLKHGPAFTSDTVINDWLYTGNDFERWADSIGSASDYASTWGAWKAISAGILADTAAFALTVGSGVKAGVESIAGALKYLPFVAIGLAVLFVGMKARK
jgi:hypothetical protein